jgi:hypothetical protein
LAGSVVLVEGESDRIALVTLARRLGTDLGGVGLVAMGGVTNLGRFLREPATRPRPDRVVVLHDGAESSYVRRTLGRYDGPAPAVFACDADLEDELIRALGMRAALALVEAAGDLGAWETLCRQPYHRDRPAGLVLRRFLGTTSGRKHRYAALLVEALDLDRVPSPLLATLAAATG